MKWMPRRAWGGIVFNQEVVDLLSHIKIILTAVTLLGRFPEGFPRDP
jgi:hypothetical protein